jgi:hypothetical protein
MGKQLDLAHALTVTARRLREGAPYNWTHQGMCNCGHLAQTVTKKTRQEIHAYALQKVGEWADHAVDHCPGSGYPIDHIIDELVALGMTTDDIVHLERLDDARVLRALPGGKRDLKKNNRDDVVLYMETWARMLSE